MTTKSINKVFIVGEVYGAPEQIQLNSGSSMAKFHLKLEESYKDKQGGWQTKETIVPVTTFGMSVNTAMGMHSGQLVSIEAKVSGREYNDKHYIEIVAERIVTLQPVSQSAEVAPF